MFLLHPSILFGVFAMSYHLMLTDKEVKSLAQFVDWGYFPAEIYDDMGLAEGELDPDDRRDVPADLERKWEFSESAAWSLPKHREDDPHSLFACMGGPLLEKVKQLENQIV